MNYNLRTAKQNIQQCPILYPSISQFSNFYQYTHMLERKYKESYGMVKIVPPKGWISCSQDYQQKIEKMMINNPIQQSAQGQGDFMEAKNMMKSKRTFKEYRKYAEEQQAKVADKSIEERRELFWKTVNYSPPLYGSDLIHSIMDSNAGQWQFSKLNSLLNYALNHNIKGVNEPYCYVGSWKTFFSWHKQDMDLSAINYLHEGKPKVWYCISTSHAGILEKEAKNYFTSQYLKCKQFLRHKTFIIKPSYLTSKHPHIKMTTTEQHANEIIIVFGGAYHCGFNSGFNIAQAVNFATQGWMGQVVNADYCRCSNQSIRIDLQRIFQNLEYSPIIEEIRFSKGFNILRKRVQSQLQIKNFSTQCITIQSENGSLDYQNLDMENDEQSFQHSFSKMHQIKLSKRTRKDYENQLYDQEREKHMEILQMVKQIHSKEVNLVPTRDSRSIRRKSEFRIVVRKNQQCSDHNQVRVQFNKSN